MRIVFLSVLWSILLLQAQPSAPKFPEPPIWLGDRSMGAQPHQYVFLSPSRDELIIRPPPNSEYLKTHSGSNPIIRYHLHNRIEPSISAKITTSASGNYLFDYVISNSEHALDNIGELWLVVPTDSGKPVVSSRGWGGGLGGLSSHPIIRQVELPEQSMGRIAMWYQEDKSKKIQPAASYAGFHIESFCKPGFTTALFGAAIGVYLDQELPNEVFGQLGFFNDPAWGKAPVLTFGPQFCNVTNTALIVRNMSEGVHRLIELNRLNPKSMFVQDVLSFLAAPDSNYQIRHAASGDFEKELLNVLSLSLGLKSAIDVELKP